MSKSAYPSELAERFQIRMPEGLRDRIRAEAAANNRSMNSEIIARLEATFASPFNHQEMTDLMRELKETLERVQAAEAIVKRGSGLRTPREME